MSNNNGSNLDERVTSLEKQVAVVATKVDDLVRELHDFKDEMRTSRARQDADMREIREGLHVHHGSYRRRSNGRCCSHEVKIFRNKKSPSTLAGIFFTT